MSIQIPADTTLRLETNPDGTFILHFDRKRPLGPETTPIEATEITGTRILGELVSACERTSVEYKHAGEPGKCAKESERVCRLIPTNIRVHRFAESVSVNKFVNFGCARSLQRVATAYGRTDRQVRRGPTVAVGYIVKPPEPIYPTSTVLFYARQMPKKKATSKRKAKQRDEEETLEAAPAESPAPSARRSTRSTIHLDDDGPSVTPRSKQVELVESDKTDSAHPFA